MRPGAKIMFSIAAFLGIVALVYIFATMWVQEDGYLYGVEWTGSIAIVLAFLLAMMLGGYLQFTGNRIDTLPEDWEEAEVEDKAGVLGFFSPGSIWPFAMSVAVGVLGFGLVFFYYWMIALGVIMLVWACTMLSLQYGMPKEKH